MKPSIRQLGRNTRRSEQILRTLAKYGLSDVLGRNLPQSISNRLESPDGQQLTDLTRQQKIRLAFAELGTTFIKLGQILSTRSDLVGPELAEELAHLQSSTPADPPEAVRATIKEELGKPPEELFASFEADAMASASIGQVHRATLHDGRPVVVKVQHDGIERLVQDDLEILYRLTELAEKNSKEIRLYRPRTVVDQFRRDLMRELDFVRECRNLERFRANFADDPRVLFPEPFPELSSVRVLTMERIEGKSVKHAEELEKEGADLQDVARRGVDVFLKMVFRDRFYHADPHPGNIFLVADDGICLLDSGMTGRLDDRLRGEIEDLLAAAVHRDSERLADAVLRFGTLPSDLDRRAFEADISEFLDEYADQSLENWNFGAMINDLTDIIRRYHIQLPANVTLLLRMLLELEGTARLLSPSFSLGEVLRPYAVRTFQSKLDPRHTMRRLARSAQDWERLLQGLPRDLADLLKRIQMGTLDVHLQHRGLEATANRLIYGILTGALVLGASLLWSRSIPPLVGGWSVPGLALAAGAGVLGFRLLRAIEGFGGLGRRDD